MVENMLEDNQFNLKVKSGSEIKEISLRKYSFSIQIKLMKSGLINKLMEIQKQMGKAEETKPENMDFVKFGEFLETTSNIIYQMLPKDIQLSKTVEEITDLMVDGEPMRFVQWLFKQFGKNNSFLAQENPPEVSPQG